MGALAILQQIMLPGISKALLYIFRQKSIFCQIIDIAKNHFHNSFHIS